jgi:flagellar biosynthesis protein FlhA
MASWSQGRAEAVREQLVADPVRLAPVLSQLSELARQAAGDPTVILCGQLLRRPLRRTLVAAGLDLPVLAYPELPAHCQLHVIGAIGAEQNIDA